MLGGELKHICRIQVVNGSSKQQKLMLSTNV